MESRAAHRHLSGLEDPIAELVRRHGVVDASLPSLPVGPEDRLSRLILSIVGQQISLQAAAAIYGRLLARFGGRLDADALVAAGEDELRAVGLSRAKANAVRELGREVAGGRLRLDELDELPDDAVLARLVALRGIGPWSAEMFLLRTLRRPDVFPAGDVGLRRAIEALDRLPAPPSVPQAAARARAWAPYRSYAAKYLWLLYAALTRGAG